MVAAEAAGTPPAPTHPGDVGCVVRGVVGEATAVLPPPPPPPPLWHSFIAGAASGLAARVVTYPADTLKARLQVRGALSSSSSTAGAAAADTAAAYRGGTLAAARHIAATEGLAGFYRGFGAILWGVMPANLAYFGGYEAGKRLLLPALNSSSGSSATPLVADMAVGAGAQLLAGLVYTPIDVVKERLQVQVLMRGAYSYGSAAAAFRALLQQPGQAGGGVLAGVLRGYWATNAVWLPWNALYIAGYERAKRGAAGILLGCDDSSSSSGGGAGAPSSAKQQQPQQLPAWAVAGCSATAAAGAALLTHPFDVVKTRLQVLSAAPGGTHLTALSLARLQWAAEGPASFWAGLSARLLNIAPGCALSWALYENLKGWLGEEEEGA